MICGGNRRLKEFFRGYPFPQAISIRERYLTRAAQFYREMVKSECEGRPLGVDMPTAEEGLVSTDPATPSSKPKQVEEKKTEELKAPEIKEEPQPRKSSWWSDATSAVTGAINRASDATSSVPLM